MPSLESIQGTISMLRPCRPTGDGVEAPEHELQLRGTGRLESISEIPEENADASKVYEAKEVLGVAFPSVDEAAVVLEPREEALDLPASAVAAQWPAVLGWRALAVAAVRRNQLDPSFFSNSGVERVAVVRAVPNYAIGGVIEEAVVERFFDERYLMR
jgi:hypothetical protein